VKARASVTSQAIAPGPDDGFAAKLAAVPHERRLGVFYTPDALAAGLVKWALAGDPGPLLEPSFGGCSFLRAAVDELQRLGGSAADVVGVDVDEEAAAPAAVLLIARGLPAKNLVYADFLALRPGDLGAFKAVVGNPPFVRHHWQHPQWQRHAQQLMREWGASVSLRSSAWAYFTVHATSFLQRGGRLAFVLPGAVLQADYAKTIVAFLEHRFADLRLLRVSDRVFEDAEEEAVILLAAGHGQGPCRALVQNLKSGASPNAALDTQGGADIADIKTGLLPKQTKRLLNEILTSERVSSLNQVAAVRIGVVTGANDFFVRPKSELRGIKGTRGAPIVSRSSWLQTPWWTKPQFDHRETAGEHTRLLLIDSRWRRRGSLGDEISEAEASGLAERSHCKRRAKWWSLEDAESSHAFLPYMGARPRGLVLNETRATCTNSVHRVIFKSGVDRETVCLSTWTTLFDVAAELAGRHYGGGVLKLEPSRAHSLPVLTGLSRQDRLSPVRSLFEAGDIKLARRKLDELFLCEELGLSEPQMNALRSAARELRTWRMHTSSVPAS
jgi:hypothetical protein